MKRLLKFIYIIDSGFKANKGISLTQSNFSIDCLGHGTRMFEIIKNTHSGIVTESIKVFECSYSTPNSNILRAISYIEKRPKGLVNMSFSSAKNQAVNQAVNLLIKKGFTVVAAAGNNGLDACNYSPASSKAITIGTPKSNFGSCVNVVINSTKATSSSVATAMYSNRLIKCSKHRKVKPFKACLKAQF